MRLLQLQVFLGGGLGPRGGGGGDMPLLEQDVVLSVCLRDMGPVPGPAQGRQ